MRIYVTLQIAKVKLTTNIDEYKGNELPNMINLSLTESCLFHQLFIKTIAFFRLSFEKNELTWKRMNKKRGLWTPVKRKYEL